MGDVSINRVQPLGTADKFEASTTPRELSRLNPLNIGGRNDQTIPIQLRKEDGTAGPTIYISDKQRSEIGRGQHVGDSKYTVTVQGKTYALPDMASKPSDVDQKGKVTTSEIIAN